MINPSNWKEFTIKPLFKIERSASRSVKNYELGTIPFVSSGNYNNGVDSFREPHIGEELDKGNCITVSPVDGSTFYQPDDFLGRGGGGSSIILLYNENMNEYSGLFIASVIRKVLTESYYYGDMGSSTSIQNEVIKLPVTNSGEPDWDYMVSTIEQLIKVNEYRVDILRKIIF